MGYQVMPELSQEDYDELKTDIFERGVMVPVEYDEDGHVIDGHHRVKACQELGVATWPRVIRVGMTEAEKRTHARKLNMARRHLTHQQKREMIRQQLLETPEVSDRQIARELGVHQTTVGTQRTQMVSAGQVSNLDTSIGADGKEYPRTVGRYAAPEAPSVSPEQPTSARETVADVVSVEPATLAAATTPFSMPAATEFNDEEAAKSRRDAALRMSESNEWYTPARYLEAAQKVLGHIDVDPASCRLANETVKAALFYDKESDGLTRDWPGRVWLNPPYGGLSADFTRKLVEQYQQGITTEAILLVNANSTETKWFRPLWEQVLCFTDHRINFDCPREAANGSTHGSVFVYFGSREKLFARVFGEFGVIVKRWDP